MSNPYFRSQYGYKPEQDLYESLIIENIEISGNDVIYIPRTLSDNFDQIFGEDVLSSFDNYATISSYLSDFSGFSGESEMLSKFGLEVRDTATFIISRKKFMENCYPIAPDSRPEMLKRRPCEGDLIYASFSKSLFEIKFVEDEYPGFYQLHKKYVYALRCELVQLNSESFNTGNSEIDDHFNNTNNRLTYSILNEDNSYLLSEDGGRILTEDYDISHPYTDIIGYGDNKDIKKEFLDIMNLDVKNPFNERF